MFYYTVMLTMVKLISDAVDVNCASKHLNCTELLVYGKYFLYTH